MSSTFIIQFQPPKKNRVRNVKKSVLGQKCQRRLLIFFDGPPCEIFRKYIRQKKIKAATVELFMLSHVGKRKKSVAGKNIVLQGQKVV
jgi:hypothetical protein